MNMNDIYRDDADPAFIEVVRMIVSRVKQCRRFGLNDMSNHINFLYPTDHPRGYFAILKLIYENDGITRRQMFDKLNAKINMQLLRLESANMIANVNHKFHVTNIGEVYCLGAENVKLKHVKVKGCRK